MRPSAIAAFSVKLYRCLDTVVMRMSSSRLQLKSDKTDVLWCATGRRQQKLPTEALPVNGAPVLPVTSVRNLGIYIDDDLVLRTHVQRTVSCCFASLPQLRYVRPRVSADTLRTLLDSLVLSRLDYGNSEQRLGRTSGLSLPPAAVSQC